MRKPYLPISLLFSFQLLFCTPNFGQNSTNFSIENFKEQSDIFIKKRDFEQALALTKNIPFQDLSETDKIAYYFQLQKIYAPPNASNFDSMIHYIHQVLDLTTSDSIKTRQLFELGNMQVFTGKFPDANQNFKLALEGIEHLPTEMDSIRLYSRLVLTTSETAQKVQWLEKLNELAQKSSNPIAQTIAYYDQINYYLNKRDAEKMGELLPQLKSVRYRLKDSVIISNVSKMIAHCYRNEELSNLDSAEFYLIDAINHLSSRMIADEKHVLNLSLATTYFYKKEYQKAIETGEEALMNLENTSRKNSTEVRQAYSNLGFSFEALKQYSEAERYFQKELELARLQEDKPYIEGALSALIRVKKAQGKTDNIHLLYDEMLEVKDSLNTQYNQEQVSEAETRLGLDLKEKELENRDLQLVQQKKQQTFYLTLIALLAAVLGIAFWAFRRINRDKKLIAQQKSEVEQSLMEKEFLLKEIHHRVKNNLQIISSLLDKQARNSADQILKNKMQEGKDRIQSMALIHQNLYQSESLSNIDIKKYIHELAQNISATQQMDNQNIKIEIDADEIQLNIDQAIPLGLILNELLTNTFKHAFKNRQNGLIDIQFREVKKGDLNLNFSDNGKGFKSEIEIGKTKTLGMSLIKGLTQQLDGSLNYQSSDQGTHFTIQFKNEG